MTTAPDHRMSARDATLLVARLRTRTEQTELLLHRAGFCDASGLVYGARLRLSEAVSRLAEYTPIEIEEPLTASEFVELVNALIAWGHAVRARFVADDEGSYF